MSSSRAPSRLAVAFGALALLAIPAAVAAAQYLAGVALLRALYVGVPASVVCGLVAYFSARRARIARARSVMPGRGAFARVGRILAGAGLYVGITGALALGVYGILRWAQ
jgi:hypothetical protein